MLSYAFPNNSPAIIVGNWIMLVVSLSVVLAM